MAQSINSSNVSVRSRVSDDSDHDSTSCPSLQRVEEIISKSAQPYAALNELQQAQAISDLTVSDYSQEGLCWVVGLTVKLTLTGESHERVGKGGKKGGAKSDAALQCLEAICDSYLISETCLTHFNVQPVATKQLPTSKQQKDMQVDHLHLDRLRHIGAAMQSSTPTTCVSIDLEMYERDHTIPLEVGLSMWHIDPVEGNSCKFHHLIVSDWMHLQNGSFCEDNRDAFLPSLGRSEYVQSEHLQGRIQALIDLEVGSGARVVWVGHSIEGDLKWLRQMSVRVEIADEATCDIARYYRAMYHLQEYHSLVGMGQMMNRLGLEYEKAHNGGNDAAYNLWVLSTLLKQLEELMI